MVTLSVVILLAGLCGACALPLIRLKAGQCERIRELKEMGLIE